MGVSVYVYFLNGMSIPCPFFRCPCKSDVISRNVPSNGARHGNKTGDLSPCPHAMSEAVTQDCKEKNKYK